MEILAHIIVYALYTLLILAGVGLIIRICEYFYYREYRSDSVKVYYDDNDHRKGYYIVKRPRGPYPIGYPKKQIIKDLEKFEQLKRDEKLKRDGKLHLSQVPDLPYEPINPAFNIPPKPRPRWLRVLLMTPAEYLEYRRQKKNNSRQHPR